MQHAMNLVTEDGQVIAQRARADAAMAEAAAARACLSALEFEALHQRQRADALAARLVSIGRIARSAAPHVRNEVARSILGHIAGIVADVGSNVLEWPRRN